MSTKKLKAQQAEPQARLKEDAPRTRRGYYLLVSQRHVTLYKLLVQARHGLTQYEMFCEMTAYFEKSCSSEKPAKNKFLVESGSERLFIYYFEEDVPQIRKIARDNGVRMRHVVHAVLIHYLEALGVDDGVLTEKMRVFDELTQASESLLQVAP